MKESGTANGLRGTHDVNIEQMESLEGTIRDDWLSSLVDWLNAMLPDLRLPLDTTEEDLRGCLIDGTIFCTILNKLHPGSVEMDGGSEYGPTNVMKFLTAMDEMGLPSFELSDIEQGHMMPVLECLKTLRSCFNPNDGANTFQNPSRKKWNLSGELQSIQLKQGCYADLSDATVLELMKSSILDNVSTQSLFNVLYRIMDESLERKKDVPHSVACLLRKIVQEIEWRVSTRAKTLKDQNKLFRAREEKYQSRIRALETLAKGTEEENMFEKSKLEEKGKAEEQDVLQLKKEKVQKDLEISRLREELESSKKMYEVHCLKLEVQAEDNKVLLEKKLKELECLLSDSRKKVDELQSFSESKQKRWKDKERCYQSFIDKQFGVLKELRDASKSVKCEVLKTRKGYSENLNFLGRIKLKELVDAAENYHSVLAENRRLYNEVQDLKGNIRVYCRIRPFLPGQSKKQTAIEYIGENGELVVSNPSKQGKDTHRLFKFNKVFSPAATQEEVFLDTQPLIRSVLDGYNVCIFAYGQTGSGKTYTMSGPNLSSKEDWGVNYRALNDLFQISQSRRSSIVYDVGVQMVEIYNEQVRDLLVVDSSQRRYPFFESFEFHFLFSSILVRNWLYSICFILIISYFRFFITTQPNGLAVPEASMHSVNSTADVLELMSIGLMNRAVGATALNERSSRSHSILTVHVRGMDLKTKAVLRGSLHLVDLAGSERVDRSEATGDRLKEAQHINKSLSALGDVIFALAQKNAHIPYRNSKLTQVLQSSLGGQAKTLMFVQLNPDVDSYAETVSTLKFAERVSGVELGAARTNREGRDIRELMEQVSFLKETITKKDQEIEHLQLLKGNGNGTKCGMRSLRYGSSSPRGHSSGTPRQSLRHSRRPSFGSFDKAALDVDIFSANGDKNSESGSHRSMDDSRHHNESTAQTSLAERDLGQNTTDDIESRHHNKSTAQTSLVGRDSSQNTTEDIELLGFGNVDSEERLSDISDGNLSMGATDTDGSICSAVEFTLFPEVSQPPIKTEKIGKASKSEKSDHIGKSIIPSLPSKLPKLSQKVLQTKPSGRLSLSRSTSKIPSSPRKIAAAATSNSSIKPPKRRQ
ncbi:Kinesin-4 [Hibiscus syriacus]|uniref:Kinesin-4 n=1 Tax=Hibiscus syriacus TaxID=106335 RepID=A0A6A2XQS3_HIBSY|nr:Kinesin-4 [Hibiscus syriacus]